MCWLLSFVSFFIEKISLASLLDYLEILISWQKIMIFWIWVEMTKLSDFDSGLSITIQSAKLDCNPDWAIQQSNNPIQQYPVGNS